VWAAKEVFNRRVVEGYVDLRELVLCFGWLAFDG
jgi:hypothetical protein